MSFFIENCNESWSWWHFFDGVAVGIMFTVLCNLIAARLSPTRIG